MNQNTDVNHSYKEQGIDMTDISPWCIAMDAKKKKERKKSTPLYV